MSGGYLSNAEQEAKEYSNRYKYLYAFVALTMLVISGRLWYLQVMIGDQLREFSEKNRIKENRIIAPRGVILDRNGEILVDNLPGFEVVISPQYASRLEETAETVGRILGIQKSKIIQKVKVSRRQNGPFFPARIKENLTREEVFRLKLVRLDHPGLEIREAVLRNYPLKSNGAQLFGYVGEVSRAQLPVLNKKHQGKFKFRQGDIIGRRGLEETFDGKIRGTDGRSFLEVDARGRERASSSDFNRFLGPISRTQNATPGNNLQLTIDRDIQNAAFAAFQKNDRIGSVVALRPNGEVIAWVNAPSFNPNDFSKGISHKLWQKLINDPFRPLRNKVIQDPSPPGSTFKTIVALAGLQEKEITKDTTHFCAGKIKFGRRFYHCAAKHGHGKVNVVQALERSCNIFFFKLASALGIDKIAKYAKAFGIGQKTGIPLRGERSGLMPTTDWKLDNKGEAWQAGETLSNAIGQGFVLTTPLQMALAYSAIGTSGKLYRPNLVKRFLDHKGNTISDFSANFVKDLSEKVEHGVYIDKKNFAIVQKGLQEVFGGRLGTARASRVRGLEQSGKTGTVQNYSMTSDQLYATCEEMPIHLRNDAWFVGYAPSDNPVISVAVSVEHGCHGSSGAAPVGRDIMKAYIEKYHPELIKKPVRRKTAKRKKPQPTIASSEQAETPPQQPSVSPEGVTE